MQLYQLPTGAFINPLEISEIYVSIGAACLITGYVEKPRCKISLRNGNTYRIDAESYEEAKTKAAEIAKAVSS